MRFPALLPHLAVAALMVCAGPGLSAQHSQPSQQSQPSQPPSSSSQTQVPPATNARPPAPVYVTIDPLAGVRYDNKWDASVEMAYAHIKAGPNFFSRAPTSAA